MDGRADLTGDVYGGDLKPFAEAMKKVDPDIFIGAVGIGADDGTEWGGHFWWMKGLLPFAQKSADFMIHHEYFGWPFDSKGNYTNPSNPALFANMHAIPDAAQSYKDMTAKYAAGNTALPLALTEFNMINGSGEQTIELINGLFTTEVLGESIKAGFVETNYWDWRNGLDKKLGGDHGMLSSDDPAIQTAHPARPFTLMPSMTTPLAIRWCRPNLRRWE